MLLFYFLEGNVKHPMQQYAVKHLVGWNSRSGSGRHISLALYYISVKIQSIHLSFINHDLFVINLGILPQ